jgi:hypothetical protein
MLWKSLKDTEHEILDRELLLLTRDLEEIPVSFTASALRSRCPAGRGSGG